MWYKFTNESTSPHRVWNEDKCEFIAFLQFEKMVCLHVIESTSIFRLYIYVFAIFVYEFHYTKHDSPSTYLFMQDEEMRLRLID